MTCALARDKDMVDYLAGLGFMPARIRGDDFWYHSPLRNERTPSFKVNRRLNRWYDFGEGCGGNLIDFAIRYRGCTVSEFLQSLSSDDVSFYRPVSERRKRNTHTGSRITILDERPLFSYSLLRYLEERRIPIAIADTFCSEIRYAINDSEYIAIGFRNNSGGYELRSRYFKGSSSPKDVTTWVNGSDTVCLFEGFIDFLSFIALIRQSGIDDHYDYFILNSLAFFERSRPAIEAYDHIHLYLDNDTAGRNCRTHAMSLNPNYEDKSSLYKHHKDLNDFLCHPGSIGLSSTGEETKPP